MEGGQQVSGDKQCLDARSSIDLCLGLRTQYRQREKTALSLPIRREKRRMRHRNMIPEREEDLSRVLLGSSSSEEAGSIVEGRKKGIKIREEGTVAK